MSQATSKPQLTFYELSSQSNPQFWSPNTGKTRTLLNYLGIKYELRFLRYPEIEPTLKSLGVKSWQEQGFQLTFSYSLPAVTFTKLDKADQGKQETIMGGDFFIIDKLVEYFGQDYYKAIYAGDELFVKQFTTYLLRYRSMLDIIAAPFIYNILDDDECKDFYNSGKIAADIGDMIEMQKESSKTYLSRWTEFHDELINFKTATESFKENNVSTLDIKRFENYLQNFQNGVCPFIMGDKPSYPDFLLYSILQWGFQGIKGGCIEYDVLESGDGDIFKKWFDRISKYDY